MESRGGDAITQCILRLLEARKPGITITPSAVVRAFKDRGLIVSTEQVRQVALTLAHRGVLDIVQKSQTVNASTVKGSIRLRLRAQAVPPDTSR